MGENSVYVSEDNDFLLLKNIFPNINLNEDIVHVKGGGHYLHKKMP
jgi:hypothetical protein